MRTLMSALLFVVALCLTAVRDAKAAEPKKDGMQAELDKLQGLWQTSPGGMEHRDGQQVVRNPVLEGPCFFIRGDRLIWLDDEGKPSGKEETIELDIKSGPKRITRTPIAAKKDEPRLQGIYTATDSSLIVHFGLEGGPAPKRFLELNAPVKGIDGHEWLVHRKKLNGD
jgi:uncharacterized protein (TIGR03067 family)